MTSRSTCEAEILAAKLCAQEGLFVMTILEEIGLSPELHLSVDSVSALKVMESELQEAIREHRLRVFYVSGELNVADVLTKALPHEWFEHLADVLGVRGPNASSTACQRKLQLHEQWINAIA